MEDQHQEKETVRALVRITRYTVYMAMLAVACIIILMVILLPGQQAAMTPMGNPTAAVATSGEAAVKEDAGAGSARRIPADAWKAPDENSIPNDKEGEAIKFGKELIAHTGLYFGPRGSIAQITNGMNCQNCHLDGGTRYLGNNYASFIATYPKMSGRAGKVEPASERIVECFERSLAGKAPDTTGKEVRAILAYMKWIGKNVKKGQKVVGSATEKLAFLDHAADPVAGKGIYMAKCQSCHGADGEGQLNADKRSYQYPPVWGKHSYNDGAGMYRLTNLAGFVKNNMPYGATYENPQLTDEEAWNVAAFIDSQPRPHKDQHLDWKDFSKKPIDFPFGPYADGFSEKQHKYGPFGPIRDSQKKV